MHNIGSYRKIYKLCHCNVLTQRDVLILFESIDICLQDKINGFALYVLKKKGREFSILICFVEDIYVVFRLYFSFSWLSYYFMSPEDKKDFILCLSMRNKSQCVARQSYYMQ